MSCKEDPPLVKAEKIARLQVQLRRHPHQRKMPRMDLLGASFLFLIGVAVCTALLIAKLELGERDGLEGAFLPAKLLKGFLDGLLFGFIPACGFFVAARLILGKTHRKPPSTQQPFYLGFTTPLFALGLWWLLEQYHTDSSWAVYAMIPYAIFCSWVWVGHSSKNESGF